MYMKSKSRTTKHNKLTGVNGNTLPFIAISNYHFLVVLILVLIQFYLFFIDTMADVRIFKIDKWYLCKNLCDDITGAKLQSNKQVRQNIYTEFRTNLSALQLEKVAKKLSTFWAKANVPVQHKPDCINQVQKLFKRWADLKKNSSRNTFTQKAKESKFSNKFEDLFDIRKGATWNNVITR